MAHIPPSVRDTLIPELALYKRGKVRETYFLAHPSPYEKILLSVASDRISIFDCVLPAFIAQKGAILTAMNVFWRTKIIKNIVPHDLIDYGTAVDEYLPQSLRGNPDIHKRALVVKKLEMLPIEAIARGYLMGSGLASYKKTGAVCGHHLPEGLHGGSELPYAIFTPTTKAKEGHDEHITADSVAQIYGVLPERMSLELYQTALRYARSKGIILADTKFEFGFDANGALTLGDELLTPDSGRFWNWDAWFAAVRARKSPASLDKQYVREEGKRLGIADLDPRKPEDLARVDTCEIASEVCAHTAKLYRYIFSRLTGKKLEIFQRDDMGIAVDPPTMRIEIVLGSESDLPQTVEGRQFIHDAKGVESHLHIISCHRNPEALRNYAQSLPDNCVIVAAAEKATALPGMLKAWLNHFGKSNIPVIGVALKGNTPEADTAARLSIEELPGTPIVLNYGRAYFGREGFTIACLHAVESEFMTTSEAPKEPFFNLLVAPEGYV